MTSTQPSVTQLRSRTRVGSNRATPAAKALDLERVRNNQRRCRARRKEYISSLEDKIRELESVNVESRAEKKLQELAKENKSLKRLLHSLGLRDEFLDAYHSAIRVAPNLSWPLPDEKHHAHVNQRSSSFPALESLQLPPITASEDQVYHTTGLFSDASILEQQSLESSQTDTTLPWELFDFPAAEAAESEPVEANLHMERLAHSTMDTFLTREPVNTDTMGHTSDTTTLCSWAFSLVRKSNRKGYSAADLDLKLRVGYRDGATPAEGCRVDNKVLLSVLADIV